MSKIEEALDAKKVPQVEPRSRKKLSPDLFVSSGSTMLNLALSGMANGGWRKKRIVNIVGDKSTGKTLLAIEALTYVMKVLDSKDNPVRAIYDETESAFDLDYAELLGMPINKVEIRSSATVEDFYTSLDAELDKDDYSFMIYVLDSLDALSSKQEVGTKIDEGTFGTSKAKIMSQLFRRLVSKIESKNVLVMIISQIRDKIGVTFGKKQERTGGKALDFYASQVVWLAQTGKLSLANRVAGVTVKAKVDKNKVWMPYREAEFPILFEYGIDDVGSMVDTLIDAGIVQKAGTRYIWNDKKMFREDLIQELEDEKPKIQSMVQDFWDKEEANGRYKRKPKY